MADILIRDVPDETLAELDAAAARIGVSRVEYLRRTLAAEAKRVARDARPPLTRDDWKQLQELTADLADDDVMRGAWA
jgi:Antitoxin FitA-like, ribbon-helix-helix